MQTHSVTPQQRLRYCSPLPIGNIIRSLCELPVKSEILGMRDETLTLWIQLSAQRRDQIEVSSSKTIGEIQVQISEAFNLKCEYLSFQSRILHHRENILDCGVINQCLLVIKNSYIEHIVVRIQLLSLQIVIDTFQTDQTMQIIDIKRRISQKTQLAINSIRLFLGTDELQGGYSLADVGIHTDCTLYLKYSKISAIRNGSMIRLKDTSAIEIQLLTKTHQILTIGPENNSIDVNKRMVMEKMRTKTPTKLELSNKVKLQYTSGMYYYTQKGWILCSDLQSQGLKVGDMIMLASKEFVKVENITHGNQLHLTDFTYLLLEDCQSFLVNDVIISPALSIQVLYHKPLSNKELFTIEMHRSMTIADLKCKISSKKTICPQKQFLYIQNTQTLLKDTLLISEIFHQNIIVQLSLIEYDLKSKIEVQKFITFILDEQTKQFPFQDIINKTFQSVIKESFKARIRDIPFFGVLLNQKSININVKIGQIIVNQSQMFYYETFDFIVVKFPEKFVLNQLLTKFKSEINLSVIEKVQSLLASLIWKPQTAQDKYKNNYGLQEIKQILRNLHKYDLQDLTQASNYQFISDMIGYLLKKDSYYKKCYRAIPQEEGQLEFLQSYTQGALVSFRQFLSCCPHRPTIQTLLGNRSGVILHIKSIAGKQMSSSSKYPEIVFLPYTYFIVDRVERNNNVVHIKLSEIPFSLTLSKNIVLWVDDNPQNNIRYTQEKNPQFDPKMTEIIPLTSTAMARRWFQEFGWLVNRLQLKMRVITDMVRFEKSPQGEKVPNFEAGIDLIEYIFNDSGLTTPVLVFCQDYKKGKQNIMNRGIREGRYSEVTNQIPKLNRYLNFKKNLSELQLSLLSTVL